MPVYADLQKYSSGLLEIRVDQTDKNTGFVQPYPKEVK